MTVVGSTCMRSLVCKGGHGKTLRLCQKGARCHANGHWPISFFIAQTEGKDWMEDHHIGTGKAECQSWLSSHSRCLYDLQRDLQDASLEGGGSSTCPPCPLLLWLYWGQLMLIGIVKSYEMSGSCVCSKTSYPCLIWFGFPDRRFPLLNPAPALCRWTVSKP